MSFWQRALRHRSFVAGGVLVAALLVLALGLAGLGIVTPGSRLPAVAMGNLLGGFAMLAICARLAAVLGAHVLGATLAEIEMARDQFRAMLKDGAAAPVGRFSDLEMLAPVKDYPARHTSTLLAFEAATDAVRQASTRTSRAGIA